MFSFLIILIILQFIFTLAFAIGEPVFNYMFCRKSKGFFSAYQKVKWKWLARFLSLGNQWDSTEDGYWMMIFGDFFIGILAVLLVALMGNFIILPIILVAIVVTTHKIMEAKLND